MARPRWVRFPWGCVLVLALTTSTPARGSEPDAATLEAARALGYSAISDYEAGDYRRASEKLESAFAVLAVPSLGLWSARALDKVGRLLAAQQRYQEVASLSAATGDAQIQEQARRDAAAELALLEPRIPRVLVSLSGVEPSEVVITLNGQSVDGLALRVDPGVHQIVARRGDERQSQELTCPEGTTREVLFRFEPLAPTPSEPPAVPPARPEPATHPTLGLRVGADAIFVEPRPSGAALRVGLTLLRDLAPELAVVAAPSAGGVFAGVRLLLIDGVHVPFALVPGILPMYSADGWFLVVEAEARVGVRVGRASVVHAGLGPQWYPVRPDSAGDVALRAGLGFTYAL